MKIDLDDLQNLQKLAFEMTADQDLAESVAYSVFGLDAYEDFDEVNQLSRTLLHLVDKEINGGK